MKLFSIGDHNYTKMNGQRITYEIRDLGWTVVQLLATDHRVFKTGEQVDFVDAMFRVYFLNGEHAIASWRVAGDNEETGVMDLQTKFCRPEDEEFYKEFLAAQRDGRLIETSRK